MTSKVTLVTSPDDIYHDAFRISAIDLTPEQSQLLSNALLNIENVPETVIYISNDNDYEWCVDKKQKSNIILFNADSENQTLAGYLAGSKNSYYFGTLKTLHIINKRAIYSSDDLITVLGEHFEIYERQ